MTAEPMYQQPEPTVRYLAAALATIDALRGIVTGYQRDWNAELNNQTAALRAEVARLTDMVMQYYRVHDPDAALAALDAAREGTP